jgi:hypothetical protein
MVRGENPRQVALRHNRRNTCPLVTLVIDIDVLYPRCAEERYRLYAVVGHERRVLATSGTPQGIGLAIVTLHEEARVVGRRLADEGRIGVLDVMPGGVPSPRGEWIIPPYDRRPA